MEKLLKPKEIAEILGVAESTIYQWTHQGYIPCVKIGKFVRFKQSKIERWLEKQENRGRNTKKIDVDLF